MGLIAASSPFPTLASRGTHLSPSPSSSSVFKTRAGNSPLAVRDPAKGRDPECCSPRFNELIKRYFAQLPDSSSPLFARSVSMNPTWHNILEYFLSNGQKNFLATEIVERKKKNKSHLVKIGPVKISSSSKERRIAFLAFSFAFCLVSGTEGEGKGRELLYIAANCSRPAVPPPCPGRWLLFN